MCVYIYITLPYGFMWFHGISKFHTQVYQDVQKLIYQFSGIGNRNQPENGFTISQAAKFIAKSTTKNRDSLKNPTIQP